MGIGNRLAKLEHKHLNKGPGYDRIFTVECWKDGAPLNEKQALILAEAETLKARGLRVLIIKCFMPFMPGEKTSENAWFFDAVPGR